MQAVIATWLFGALAVLGFYAKRYYSLIADTPLGTVPESEEWKNEWRDAGGCIAPKANTHFRITNRVGPLLCFVPFV